MKRQRQRCEQPQPLQTHLVYAGTASNTPTFIRSEVRLGALECMPSWIHVDESLFATSPLVAVVMDACGSAPASGLSLVFPLFGRLIVVGKVLPHGYCLKHMKINNTWICGNSMLMTTGDNVECLIFMSFRKTKIQCGAHIFS